MKKDVSTINTKEIIDSLLQNTEKECDKNWAIQARRALEKLASIRSKKNVEVPELFKKVFGNQVDGRIFLQWIFDRVSRTYCAPNNENQASPTYRWSDYRLPIGISYDGIFDIMSAMIHESRHHDGGRFDHVFSWGRVDENIDEFAVTNLCENLPNCDKTHMGSFGAEVIFNASVAANCENCSTYERKGYLIRGLSQMERIIDPRSRKRLIQNLSLKQLARDQLIPTKEPYHANHYAQIKKGEKYVPLISENNYCEGLCDKSCDKGTFDIYKVGHSLKLEKNNRIYCKLDGPKLENDNIGSYVWAKAKCSLSREGREAMLEAKSICEKHGMKNFKVIESGYRFSVKTRTDYCLKNYTPPKIPVWKGRRS